MESLLQGELWLFYCCILSIIETIYNYCQYSHCRLSTSQVTSWDHASILSQCSYHQLIRLIPDRQYGGLSAEKHNQKHGPTPAFFPVGIIPVLSRNRQTVYRYYLKVYIENTSSHFSRQRKRRSCISNLIILEISCYLMKNILWTACILAKRRLWLIN